MKEDPKNILREVRRILCVPENVDIRDHAINIMLSLEWWETMYSDEVEEGEKLIKRINDKL